VSSEAEKIKKRFDEFEESLKKHMAEARRADKKRLEELDARVKALEEKLKKK
jgi:tetrahydromethanopterin S-methyltransferase subunit G